MVNLFHKLFDSILNIKYHKSQVDINIHKIFYILFHKDLFLFLIHIIFW